jgi:predicted dehydrogenase
VCGPPSVHVAQAELLARDRIVLVEKPVAVSAEEIQHLAGVRGCVPILQWRAGRAVRALRRAARHGELGDAPVVSCDLAWGRDEAYFAARAGWGCGALLSVGVHALDAVAWALGRRVVGAAGLTSTRQPLPGDVETAAVLLLRFEAGATASVRISLDGGADTTRIVACGRGVTAVIEGGEADPTASRVTWSALDPSTHARLVALENDTPGALGSPLLVPYIGAIVAALRDGESPGDSERIPTIASTLSAHTAAMSVAARATERDEHRNPARA